MTSGRKWSAATRAKHEARQAAALDRAKQRAGGGNLGIPVTLRATDEAQKARWQAAAERARRTLSDWIRVTLDDASEEQ